MDLNEFLNLKITFERIIEFPKTPVILFEPMLRPYERNDYAQKLGINYRPSGIVLQDKNYKGWIDSNTKIKITDLATIDQIIVDVRLYNEEARNALSKIGEKANNLNDIGSFKKIIEQLAEINSNIYNRFVFFTDELFAIADVAKIQELQQVRMELDDLVSNYLWKIYEKVIKMMHEKFQIDIRVLENATNEELVRILGKNSAVDTATIPDRPIAFIFLNGKKTVFIGDDVLKIKEYLSAQNPEQILIQQVRQEKIIRGQVGNNGLVKGSVIRLLVADYHSQKKLAELEQKKDYIFVTPMTQPDLVPFMKKAAAFITDEGGITCHAAIIARELKKPCIIGTKIATKVLKDGDLVEVDADKVIIKIIK